VTAPAIHGYPIAPELAAIFVANPGLVAAMQASPRREAHTLGLRDGSTFEVYRWSDLNKDRFSIDAAAFAEACGLLRLLRPEDIAVIDELDAARATPVTSLTVRRARRIAALLHYVAGPEIRSTVATTGGDPTRVTSTISLLRKRFADCALLGRALRLELH
jgi:hypothetical protein